ncbi:hypothetical protein U8326_01105 [Tsuneonella sp. CC-YZS046]|uniref:hypothetical protein n=1 Tax=Tsuneonella sp. CC-YZS046 TaxID=3042152 RepID=UPI002D77F249|nr:hypothetical protein [Tsuneonella sp. CC-YZS046]WRO66796.1 hypothetical protein U8326_01105 [Tsuneonella sp. CC-YZS046]
MTPRRFRPSQAELREMAEKLLHWSNELERDFGIKPGERGIGDRLLAIAMKYYRVRRLRDGQLPPDLFGEPAWDMLLDLYINTRRGRLVSITSLCIASAVPATTALRHISLLEERGLLQKIPAKHDRRVSYVELTEHAYQAMECHLADVAQHLHDLIPDL